MTGTWVSCGGYGRMGCGCWRLPAALWPACWFFFCFTVWVACRSWRRRWCWMVSYRWWPVRANLLPPWLEIRQPGPKAWRWCNSGTAHGSGSVVSPSVLAGAGLGTGSPAAFGLGDAGRTAKSRELTLPPAGPDGIGELDLRGTALARPDRRPRFDRAWAVLAAIAAGPAGVAAGVAHLGDLLRWAWGSGPRSRTGASDPSITAGRAAGCLVSTGADGGAMARFRRPVVARCSILRAAEIDPYAALFLLGWLVLDLRWQWDLRLRLEQTVERFAGKNEEDRRLAALDGDLYRFLLEVRQHFLPERPVRLFIVVRSPWFPGPVAPAIIAAT